MVNYSIIKSDASTVTGQADSVAAAVANINRMQADPWYGGEQFVAAFVGNDRIGCYPVVMRDGQWWAPNVEQFAAPTFSSLPVGALFFRRNASTVLLRKHDADHAKLVGSRKALPFAMAATARVVPVE